MTRSEKRTAAQQAKCDAWNDAHAVGVPVTVTLDGGKVISTSTRSQAQVLSGHTAVIWLENVSGCYDLDRVKARKGEPLGPEATVMPYSPDEGGVRGVR